MMLNKLLHKSQYSEKLRTKILSLYSLSLQKCHHTSTSVIVDCPCEAQRIRDFISYPGFHPSTPAVKTIIPIICH